MRSANIPQRWWWKKGREQTEHLLQSAPMGGAADITMSFCKFCSHYVDKGHRGTS